MEIAILITDSTFNRVINFLRVLPHHPDYDIALHNFAIHCRSMREIITIKANISASKHVFCLIVI